MGRHDHLIIISFPSISSFYTISYLQFPNIIKSSQPYQDAIPPNSRPEFHWTWDRSRQWGLWTKTQRGSRSKKKNKSPYSKIQILEQKVSHQLEAAFLLFHWANHLDLPPPEVHRKVTEPLHPISLMLPGIALSRKKFQLRQQRLHQGNLLSFHGANHLDLLPLEMHRVQMENFDLKPLSQDPVSFHQQLVPKTKLWCRPTTTLVVC